MLHNLYTPEGETLTGIPWQVYPRPQLKRDSYVNLNGEWELDAEGNIMSILVPFCPESLLSGVNRHFPEGEDLVYRRKFTLPEGFLKGRVLLHFGAVDQIAEVYLNNLFDISIADILNCDGSLQLIAVADHGSSILTSPYSTSPYVRP